MMCVNCAGKTKVGDTKASGDRSSTSWRRSLVVTGMSVFGWWSNEFVVRQRQCIGCGNQFKTIEICIDDLREAFDVSSSDPELGRPWNSRKPLLSNAGEEEGLR